MKQLFILDLDHTVIYGSFAESESAMLLFRYHQYLTVYERPLARELIKLCQEKGTVIVYTTALRRYAKMICNSLDINPMELLSRKNCLTQDGKHKKQIKAEWLENYDKIVIIDDSPNVWLTENEKIEFLVPDEFRGKLEDLGLQKIIETIK